MIGLVVKVGGSLLDWPELPGRLAAWLDHQPAVRPVLLVGGGRIVDALRDYDRSHNLGERASHALALHALDLTARLLADLLADGLVVDRLDDLTAAWDAGRVPILAPRRFLDDEDRGPAPLPHAWTVTSDSIAARLAVRLGVGRLVLLKSAPPPAVPTRAEAARLGLVDPEFPGVAGPIERVDYLNFRDDATRPVELR